MSVQNLFPNKSQFDLMNSRLADIALAIGATVSLSSFKNAQSIVRSGRGPDLIPPGTLLRTTHTTYGEIVFEVMQHNVDKHVSDPDIPTMTLLARNVAIDTLQYDNAEAFYYCASALAAGTYSFTVPETIAQWTAGTYKFTTTAQVPAGGILKLSGNWGTALTSLSVQAFASRSATTASFTCAITSGSGGTSLGTWGTELNHAHRIGYGSNNWKESAMRQFLNSEGAAGQFWTPQTKFDYAPSWNASTAGFLAGFDDDFLDSLGVCSVHNISNSVYESPDSAVQAGERYTTQDRIWLPSRKEIYGDSEGVGEDVSQFPLYVGTEAAAKIKYNNSGVYKPYWLRSPTATNARYVRVSYTGGSLNDYSAALAVGVVPACIIA